MKLLVAALAMAAAFVVSNRAEAACTQVSGTGQATDGVCTQSALGLCASGTLTGTLAGTYVGAFQSISPSPTLAQPLRLAITLTSTITTSTGSIQQDETGYLVLNDVLGAASCLTGCLLSSTPDVCLAGCVSTYGRTTFEQDMVPQSGTGAYSSITGGSIVATGYGDYTSDISYVNYSGQICD